MLTIQQVRERLQDRKLSKIAATTGLHVNTIANVRDGDDKSEHLASVIEKLADYLETAEEKAA